MLLTRYNRKKWHHERPETLQVQKTHLSKEGEAATTTNPPPIERCLQQPQQTNKQTNNAYDTHLGHKPPVNSKLQKFKNYVAGEDHNLLAMAKELEMQQQEQQKTRAF